MAMNNFMPNVGTSAFRLPSTVTVSMALSAFLVVVLALTLQQTQRLNVEIERLHWQLSLAQFTHTKNGREQSEQVNQVEVLRRIEKALQDQNVKDDAPKESVTTLLTDLRKDIENSQRELRKEVVPLDFPLNLNQTCPSPDVDNNQSEAMDAWTIATKSMSAALLVMVVVGAFWVYGRLDNLPQVLPRPLASKLKYYTKSLPPSKVLAYRMDNWFSTNPNSKAVALMTVTLLLVGVGGVAIFSVSDTSLYNALWEALAGVGIDWTFSEEAGSGRGFSGVATRVVATIVSLGGLLVTALMLGIVSEAISEKVDEMKKGVSEVLESDHTLILGWSDKLIPVVIQIILANESIGGAPIVIMAERDKEEMEAELARANLDMKGSRIICRSGNPLLRYDLAKVSVHLARSIIVLANHQSPDQSDARVLRIVLSLVALHDKYKERGGLKGHIVAEMCDVDNEPLVKMVGRDKVETVVAHDIIGRLMIQCARQPGLAGVWEELMGYEGAEFYFQEWPELEGKTFGEIVMSFPDAIPLGITPAHGRRVNLNPESGYVFQRGDQLLVLAEDDDTYQPGPYVKANAGERPQWEWPRSPEKILFCGWRRDMDDMIIVMDEFVSPGSELTLYNEVPIHERHELLKKGGLDPDVDLKNLTLYYQDEKLKGDLVTRKKLENLDPASFSSILILADESATGNFIADADSRNLATLLLLRDIMMKSKQSEGLSEAERLPSLEFFQNACNDGDERVIISEILDLRTRNLIQELSISEFVMSNELVSMVLAMVSESATVNTVLKELFTDEGNELYVFPSEKYLRPGENLSFYDLMARCQSGLEVCMGYKENGTVILNPPKKHEQRISLETIEAVVVLADAE
ncbi:hypothetical protein BSKO_07059 [Bryopsis sp. KO-2023]|nr:hypothetical protein BSKO_07059 [Bryopsis sp. KO-2023]